jgi:hypothetical protein
MMQKQSFTQLSDLAPRTRPMLEQNKNIAKRENHLRKSKRAQKSPSSHGFSCFDFFVLTSLTFFRASSHVAFRTRLPKLPRVKILLLKLSFAAAVLTIALGLNMRASSANLYGESPWCAVTDDGGRILWDCEYETVDACRPAVLAGNRGFCAINPYWRRYPTPYGR